MIRSGHLPKSWSECTLGDVVNYGATEKAEPTEISDDAWVLELEDVESNTSQILQRATFAERRSKSTKNRFRAGDVLYGKLRPYLNKVVRADQSGFCTTEIVPISPPEGVDAGYLFHWLKHPRFISYVSAVSHGLNMPRLGTDAGKQAPLVLAPTNEQKRIVAKIEELTARSRRAREALNAAFPLLDQLRQAILAAALSGDLTADWRAENANVEPAHKLIARIRAERRVRWEAAELMKLTNRGKRPSDDRWKTKYKELPPRHSDDVADVPAGWAWGTVELVGDVLLGRRRAAEEYVEGVDGRVLRPYVRVANVKRDRLVLDDVLTMPFSPEELELYRLQPGDIVLSEGQSPELVGQSGIFDGNYEDLCIQATVHRFRAYEFATTSEFAQLVFLNHLLTGVFRNAASLTTNIAHLTSERLRPLPFPIPPLAEQAAIVRKARAALASVERLSAQVAAMAERAQDLDRSILAKGFRGELVQRDPTDEPAAVLLKRIGAAYGSPASRAPSDRLPR